jgi:pentatricopeptide repeat protein
VADVHAALADPSLKLKLVHVNQAIGRCGAVGGAASDIDRLITSLAEHELLPDVYTYATAIAACSNKRAQQADWRRAVALLRNMQATHGLAPDGVCYGAAVAACAQGRTNAAAEAALALVAQFASELRQADATTALEGRSRDSSGGAAPSSAVGFTASAELSSSAAHVYVSAMKACGHAGKWQASLRLLQELGTLQQPGGSARSAFAWTAAVAACGSAGQWRQAVALLDDMAAELRASAAPFQGDPTAAYNAAITACGRAGQWAAALAVFDRIRPAEAAAAEAAAAGPPSSSSSSRAFAPPLPSYASASVAGSFARAAAPPSAAAVVPSDAALAAALVTLRLSTPGLGHQKLTAALHGAQPAWAVNAQRVRRTMKLAQLAPGAPPPANKPPPPPPPQRQPLSARAQALRAAATAYKYDPAAETAEVAAAAAAVDAAAAFQAAVVVEVAAQATAAEAAAAEAALAVARRAAASACGARADLVSYNACLGALERGQQAHRASALFRELQRLSSASRGRREGGRWITSPPSSAALAPPDRVSVNALLSALARGGDWVQAMEVAEANLAGMGPAVAAMRAGDPAAVARAAAEAPAEAASAAEAAAVAQAPAVPPLPLPSPDRTTFTLLAKACCLGGQPWLALEAKAAMRRRLGLEADATLLRTLICVCEDGHAGPRLNLSLRDAPTPLAAADGAAAAALLPARSLAQTALVLREELRRVAPNELVRRSHGERRAAAAARDREGPSTSLAGGAATGAVSSPSPLASAGAAATGGGKLRELGFTSGEGPGVVARWSFARRAVDEAVAEAKAEAKATDAQQAPAATESAALRAVGMNAGHSSRVADKKDKAQVVEGDDDDDGGEAEEDGDDEDGAALEEELEGVLDDLGLAVHTTNTPTPTTKKHRIAGMCYITGRLAHFVLRLLFASQVEEYRTSESAAMRAIQEATSLPALDAALASMARAGLAPTLWHYNAAIATAGERLAWPANAPSWC